MLRKVNDFIQVHLGLEGYMSQKKHLESQAEVQNQDPPVSTRDPVTTLRKYFPAPLLIDAYRKTKSKYQDQFLLSSVSTSLEFLGRDFCVR